MTPDCMVKSNINKTVWLNQTSTRLMCVTDFTSLLSSRGIFLKKINNVERQKSRGISNKQEEIGIHEGMHQSNKTINIIVTFHSFLKCSKIFAIHQQIPLEHVYINIKISGYYNYL